MGRADDNYRQYCDSCCGVYPDDDFEGVRIDYWPNGQLKFRGEYKKGEKRIGQHVCLYPNGVLQEVSYWNDGYACGTVIRFREDGSKESETDYSENGGRTRSWKERSYHIDGTLYAVEVCKDGQVVAEWLDGEVRKILDAIDADGLVDEAVKLVHPEDPAAGR